MLLKKIRTGLFKGIQYRVPIGRNLLLAFHYLG
jgi:hypothetical protein